MIERLTLCNFIKFKDSLALERIKSNNSKMLLVFSHELTTEQVIDAKKSLGIQSLVQLPKNLLKKWENIPPDIPKLKNYVQDICDFILEKTHAKDYVLIQGEYGAVFLMVQFAFKHNLIPVYATTKREVTETITEEERVKLSRTFKHVRFRKYELL